MDSVTSFKVLAKHTTVQFYCTRTEACPLQRMSVESFTCFNLKQAGNQNMSETSSDYVVYNERLCCLQHNRSELVSRLFRICLCPVLAMMHAWAELGGACRPRCRLEICLVSTLRVPISTC